MQSLTYFLHGLSCPSKSLVLFGVIASLSIMWMNLVVIASSFSILCINVLEPSLVSVTLCFMFNMSLVDQAFLDRLLTQKVNKEIRKQLQRVTFCPWLVVMTPCTIYPWFGILPLLLQQTCFCALISSNLDRSRDEWCSYQAETLLSSIELSLPVCQVVECLGLHVFPHPCAACWVQRLTIISILSVRVDWDLPAANLS